MAIMRAPLHESSRRRLITRARTLVVALVSALLLTLLPSFAAANQAADEDPLAGLDAPRMPAECYGPGQTTVEPAPCPLNTYRPKRPTIILWGDSHAYQYIPALREAVRGAGVNLVSFVAGSCAPFAVNRRPGTNYSGKCERSNDVAMSTIEDLIRKHRTFKVILGSNWSGFRIAYRRIFLNEDVPADYEDYTRKMVKLSHEGTPKLFTQLGRMGVDVDVIAQAATVPVQKSECAAGTEPYLCDLPRWRALPEERDTEQWLRGQMSKLKGSPRYIDATGGYCNASVCHGQIGDIKTFFDNLHLSATRTRNLDQYFGPSVREVKRAQQQRNTAHRMT